MAPANSRLREPFIPANDPDWINNTQTRIKERHAGLMVYNLTADAIFKPGMYIWDGVRWQSSEDSLPKAYNGLSIGNDSLFLGGTLTKPTTVDLANNTLSLTGRDTLHIATPVNLNDLLAYLGGGNAPADGMLFMSDADGNASWKPRSTLPSTPSAVFTADGITVDMKDNNVSANHWFWVRSSFVKEGETQVDPAFFVGTNQLISARIHPGLNIINGYVIMKNDGQAPVKFWYHAGRVNVLAGSANCNLNSFGSKEWGENSVIAFALE